MAAVAVVGILFCAAMLIINRTSTFAESYRGFMLECSSKSVLPLALMLQLAGGVRYGAFERCRSNPTNELYANIAWLMQIALASGVWSVLVFTGLETLAFGQPLHEEALSLLGLMFVQTVMMTVTVGSFVLLLVNCGLSFGHVTPPVIAFFALASWLLTPFAGDLTRYAYYFWYPISPSWQEVLIQQIIPCCGYCLLMGCANAIAFSRTDRLEA